MKGFIKVLIVLIGIYCFVVELGYAQKNSIKRSITSEMEVIISGKVTKENREALEGVDYTIAGDSSLATNFTVFGTCFKVLKATKKDGKILPELKNKCLGLVGEKAKEVEQYENKGEIQIKGIVKKGKVIDAKIISETAKAQSTNEGINSSQKGDNKNSEKIKTVSGHIESLYKRKAELSVQITGSPQPWPDMFIPKCSDKDLPEMQIPLYLSEFPEKKFFIKVDHALDHGMVMVETRSGTGCIIKNLAKSQGWNVKITFNKDDLKIADIEVINRK